MSRGVCPHCGVNAEATTKSIQRLIDRERRLEGLLRSLAERLRHIQVWRREVAALLGETQDEDTEIINSGCR